MTIPTNEFDQATGYMPEDLPVAREPWAELEDQGVRWFKEVLAIDSTNPPGNESRVADWLCPILDAEGIGYERLESAPGRSNVIARLEGTGEGKGFEPIALMAHMDVVPHEPEHWTQKPFGGEEIDGWIYGRGAVDMKYMLVENLVTLVALKRSGKPLKRDVIFVALADEEAGCAFGIEWLVAKHPQLVECRWGINEVGGFPVWINGRKKAYLVQTAEKGICWCRIRIPGTPGHGSIPIADNAVAKAAELVLRLHKGIFPHQVTPPARQFIQAISAEMGGQGSVVRQILNPLLFPVVCKLIKDEEQRNMFNTILHNTANPTVMDAGKKVNVIPSEVIVEVDGRTLPGVTTEQFLARLRPLLPAGSDLEVINEGSPYVVPASGPLYNTLVDALQTADPGVPTVPFLMSGYTDSKYMETFGAEIYGFAPVQFPPDIKFTSLIHGHDERAPAAGFRWGMRLHCDAMTRFCVRRD